MAKKKALWLKNNTGSDVSLSDLGVKVLAGQTTNVYAYNPYVTIEQIKKSMEDGSLFKRLGSKTLTVVKGTKNKKPHTLNHIKASNKVVEIVKSKTSVFIDTKEEDVLIDDDLGDLGDIADYGLGELGHNNVTYVKTNDGSIVVKQKEDLLEDEVPDVILKPKKVKSDISEQSIIAMTKQVASQSNPVGPIANSSSPADQPFVVVNPPKEQELQKATAIEEAEAKLYTMNKAKSRIKKVGETFVVDEKDTSVRNLKTDGGIKEETTYDTQVATKDESGAIIMKIKEVTKEPEKSKVEKPKAKAKAVKVTKTKTKIKGKKKTSKKK